jgi:hypothetical protein
MTDILRKTDILQMVDKMKIYNLDRPKPLNPLSQDDPIPEFQVPIPKTARKSLFSGKGLIKRNKSPPPPLDLEELNFYDSDDDYSEYNNNNEEIKMYTPKTPTTPQSESARVPLCSPNLDDDSPCSNQVFEKKSFTCQEKLVDIELENCVYAMELLRKSNAILWGELKKKITLSEEQRKRKRDEEKTLQEYKKMLEAAKKRKVERKKRIVIEIDDTSSDEETETDKEFVPDPKRKKTPIIRNVKKQKVFNDYENGVDNDGLDWYFDIWYVGKKHKKIGEYKIEPITNERKYHIPKKFGDYGKRMDNRRKQFGEVYLIKFNETNFETNIIMMKDAWINHKEKVMNMFLRNGPNEHKIPFEEICNRIEKWCNVITNKNN